MTTALALLAVLASMPPKQDLAPPAAALTGPSSPRLALPITLRFDVSLNDDISDLIRKDTGKSQSRSREPVYAVARYAPAVARRHFEEAKWDETDGDRAVVVKSVSVSYSPGPHYEVKVVADRYENGRRVGQATGSGWGTGDRTSQRAGAAWAGPFGHAVNDDANQAKGEEDGPVIRSATVAALDNALYQLAAVWAGEQMMQKAMEQAKPAAPKKKK